MTHGRKDDPLCVVCGDTYDTAGHYVPAFFIDLRCFRDGRNGEDGYAGRPNLTAQILRPAFLGEISRMPEATSRRWKWAIGHLWKSIDGHEDVSGCGRVDDVRVLVDRPWKAFKLYLRAEKRADFAHMVYKMLRKVVAAALEDCGVVHFLPKNPFPVPPSRRRETESPYDAGTTASALEALAEARRGTIGRIERAEAMADAGDDPETTLARWKTGREEFHAVWTPENTARLIRDHAMPRLLCQRPFERQYRVARERVLRQLADAGGLGGDAAFSPSFNGALYRPFLPVAADFASWPTELVLRTGINLQAAFDFDRADWFERVGPDQVIMFTRKTRKGGKIVEVDSDMGPDSPFAIVDAAIRSSRRAHEMVSRELDELQSLPAHDITESIDRRIQTLRKLSSRVWLVLRRRPLEIAALTTSYWRFRTLTNQLLLERGVGEGEEAFEWSSRRARDGFAYDLFRKAGLSLPAVSDGLHQDSPQLSAAYVDHPLSRKEDTLVLLRIWETMRSDLLHLARHGRRPEPPPVEDASRPALSVSLFGPAAEWLASKAPPGVADLFRDHAGGAASS